MNELGLLKDCVEFNACVTKIDWDRLDGTVQLITDKGITYEADHVVVTVSLGVLKQNPQLFEPRLPLPKLRAINFMGFGTVTKIFVEFNEPFWQDNWPGFNAMWRTDDMYQPQLEWVADIYGFHRYPFQPRVLLGWAAGPHTDTIESIDSKMLAQGVLYMLRRFLPKLKIPQPKLVTTSKWSKDPAYLGGYSYPTLLSKSYNVSAMDLLQPCNLMAYESYELQQSFVSIMPMTVRPILLFAGEATSPHHFSTVHGAVETGLREARRLIGYYMKDNY
ncbi:spermine oxidase isoform X2 [Drosophila busckii]|nr:spermine oxidase isoform X2 [Drosophila busckii]